MKRIAMSDIHLGQDGADGTGSYSLLSRIPKHMKEERAKAQEKMAKLKDLVERFAGGSSVTLIGCGDILDLSLAYFNQAYQDLAYLLENLPSVNRFVHVVGNHDHHIWSMHCEQNNIAVPLMEERPWIWGTGIYVPTNRIGEPFDIFTQSLSKKIGRRIMFDVAYPSCGFGLPNHDFYFTHGHLFGGLYNLVSRILSIFLEEELDEKKAATMNIALIELIYWLCGETGEGMGANGIIEAIHADAEKGKDSLIRQIIDKGVDEIVPGGIIKGIPDSWERKFVKWAIGKFVDRALKDKHRIVVSKDRHEDPEKTRERVREWIFETLKVDKDRRMTFVFGHTHRSGSAAINEKIDAYNLGSWLVEPKDADPDTELLMIDDDGIIVMERI